MAKFSLTRFPSVKASIINRWPQFMIFTVMLAAFLFAILSGFIGTPVGNRNFSIVFIWIAWWAILILIAVPLFGRGWCAVCPIPLPGEWLRRSRVLGPALCHSEQRPQSQQKGSFIGLSPAGGLRWPKALRNIWFQNASFLLVALFSSVILTTPSVTSIVLAAMLFLALGLSLVFERRSFCRYLCPVGGFIGLYSQVAPLELRIQNKAICAACTGKPCYNGSSAGYGCPWGVFPGGLTKNTYCGLCMECLRTCPHDNLSINLRPFAADLAKPLTRLDESFKAFIMVGSALVYAAVLLGPWGILKSTAYQVFSTAWFGYAIAFLSIILIVLPGIFWGVTVSGHKSRGAFQAFSTSLVPLGLMFWAAFSLSFVLTNASYILITLSDPFGWGWNLFGTSAVEWQPLAASFLAPIQSLPLVGGFFWAAQTTRKIASERGVSALPVTLFCLSITTIMLWLLI